MAGTISSGHALSLPDASSTTTLPMATALAATTALPDTHTKAASDQSTLPPSSTTHKGKRPWYPRPRLSPRLYYRLRDMRIAKFTQYFELVSCGPEAPDKTSHGDVDLLFGKVKQSDKVTIAEPPIPVASLANGPDGHIIEDAPKPTAAEKLSQCETLQAMGQPLKELTGADHWHFRDGVMFLSFFFPDKWLERLKMVEIGENQQILDLDDEDPPRSDQQQCALSNDRADTHADTIAAKRDSVLAANDETSRVNTRAAAGDGDQLATTGEFGASSHGHIHKYKYTVDFVYTPYISSFAMERLFNAYGDLSDIIYTGLLSAGITLKPSGVFVRVPDIQYDPDAFDTGKGKESTRHEARDASMIFLSKNVHELFRFLGMDPEKYDRGFASMDELFEWIGGMRYFYREDFYASHTRARDAAFLSKNCLTAALPAEAHETPESRIKGHNKRMLDRPMFQRFVNTYLATHPEFGAAPSTLQDRNRIMHAALDHFSAHTRYHEALSSYLHRKREKAFWTRVMGAMPTFVEPGKDSGGNVFPLSTNRKNAVALAMKRCVVLRSIEGRAPTPHIVEKVEDMKGPEGFEVWTRYASLEPKVTAGNGAGGTGYEAIAGPGPNESELLEWIKGHWAECYEFDRASTREERHKKVKAREEAKKAAGLSSMPC